MDFETLLRSYQLRDEFSMVRNQLQQEKKTGVVPNVEQLMHFIANMHQYQRRPNPDKLIRIPTKLFLDFNAKGGLYYILKASLGNLGVKFDQNWLWNQHQARQECSRLIYTVVEILKYSGLYRTPVIYLSDSIPSASRMALLNTAKKLGCEVSNSLTSAVTHVLVDSTSLPSKKARIVGTLGQLQQKHHGGKPDSLDVWIQGPKVKTEPPLRMPYYVSSNWLIHSLEYREYMNESDYLSEAVEASSLTNTQEELFPDDGPSDVASPFHDFNDFAIDDSNESGTAKTAVWPIVSVVNLNRKLLVKFKRSDYEPPSNPRLLNISPAVFIESQHIGSIANPPPPVQSFAADKVSDYEELALGVYWGESESEKRKYLDIRNFLIDLYRERPLYRVDLPFIKKMFPEIDIVYLNAIHALLEHTRNINSVLHAVGSKPCSLYQMDKLKTAKRAKNNEPADQNCRFCAQTLLSVNFSLLDESFTICDDCFFEGRFPHQLSSSDFRCNTGLLNHSYFTGWSTEDNLKLLELIELHHDDWEAIGSALDKLPEECKIQFVSFKIGKQDTTNFIESFIENSENPVLSLISLLSHAVCPPVGAIAAKYAMEAFSNSTETTDLQSFTAETARRAYQHVLEQLKNDNAIEEANYNKLINILEATQLKRIKLKLKTLKSLQETANLYDYEKSQLSKFRYLAN